MEEIKLTTKIMYDGFLVISARKLNHIIFIKTINIEADEIYWFLGFELNKDILTDIKRILIEGNVYTNSFFRTMFCK